jgi:hypothetical protein
VSEPVITGIGLKFGRYPAMLKLAHPKEAAAFSAKDPTLIVIAPEHLPGLTASGELTGALKQACALLIKEETRKGRGFRKSKLIMRLQDSKAIEGEFAKYSAQVKKRREPVRPKVMFINPVASSVAAAQIEKAIDVLDLFDQPPAPATIASPEPDDGARRLQLARERRDELLAHEKWFNAPEVHEQQGKDPQAEGVNNTASKLRRRDELLGVWNGREYLHPQFQFDPQTGLLMPEVKQLLDIMPKDRSGWRQAFWLFQKHAQLEGKRPADVFQKDAALVIEAARSDFVASDERW